MYILSTSTEFATSCSRKVGPYLAVDVLATIIRTVYHSEILHFEVGT